MKKLVDPMEIVDIFRQAWSGSLIMFETVPINNGDILEQNRKENELLQSFIQQKYQ